MTVSFADLITFSRGSNATIVDATGKITYAPNNLLRQSQTFDNATWSKTNTGGGASPTVTADYAVAPDGTVTADRVQYSLNGVTSGALSQLQQSAAPIAKPAIFSVWLKSNTGASQVVQMRFNSSLVTALWTVTPEWQRFYYLGAGTGSGLSYGVQLASGVTADTADILIWGAQLEQVSYQTEPSDYNVTVASAYYGPRFDYNPVTLTSRGLLVEESRTNLLRYSEDLTNAQWTLSSATVTANAVVAPDGTTTADKLVEDTATITHLAVNTVTTTATATTFSVYAKPAGRTWIALAVFDSGAAERITYFDIAAGTVGTTGTGITATITPAGDGWYRCAVTIATAIAGANQCRVYLTTGNGVIVYAGDGTSGAYIWGAQVEAGGFATSYIPTAANALVRSADVATVTGTNFSAWYNATEGTVVCKLYRSDASGATRGAWRINDGTTNNGMDYRVYNGNNTVQTSGVTQADLNAGGGSANAVVTNVFAFKNNSFAAATDSGAPVTDASGTVPTVTQLVLGALSNTTGEILCGHVQQFQFYSSKMAG